MNKEKKNGYLWNIYNCGQCIARAALLVTLPLTSYATDWRNVVFTLNNAAVTPEGYLDVTKAPYNLNNNGGGNAGENTTNLQTAIHDAHTHNLAVFFPTGTYLINNKLNLFQIQDHMTLCHVLVGSATGARPVIKLTGSNFNDAGNPKPVFHYYASNNGTGPPSADKAASGYNMIFRGIDIDLSNKSGAIGIDMHAAQGSTIQDVKILATGAFAGIKSLCGSGTTHANIHIEGGQYGIYVSNNRPMPTITGLTCIGQSVRAIHFPVNLKGTLTVVGFKIEAANGPVFDLNASKDDEHISLVDGSIEITGGTANIIQNQNRSVYLRNVYVKNGNKIVNNVQGADLTDNTGGWSHIGEYSFFHIGSRQLIDNNFTSGEHKRNIITGNASEPPANLISRHLWDESSFPHFEDGNCIFVGPNDGPNDSVVIQNAIDSANGKAVFLKKGDYYLTSSLVFRADTKLVGVSRNLTRLHCDSSWTEASYTPMITTPSNGENATCLIAWLALKMPLNQGDNITFLDWTAGRHSMVREVHFMKEVNWNGAANGMKRVNISGTGGGRWYSVFGRAAAEQGEHPDHRLVCIQGVSDALSFYALTVEYQESEVYITEINNSSNVSIYGFKMETDINGNDDGGALKHTPPLGIVNSQNILVLGGDGHAALDSNESRHALVEIVGNASYDIQLSNITGGWGGNNGFGIVRDMYTGKVITKNASGGPGDPAALYSIGSVAPIVYSLPVSGGGEELTEFEDVLPIAAKSGDGDAASSHANASAGNYVWYGSNAVGDYITLNVDVANSGNYQVFLGVGLTPSAGKVQLKIDGTNVGGVQDLYSVNWDNVFEERDLGTHSFINAGTNQFRFEITGKNSSATNYILRLDYVRLVPLGGVTNLLVNGDFETGNLDDYSGTGSIISGANAYSGFSVEIGNNGGWQMIEQVQPASPDTEYTISGRLWVSGATSSNNAKIVATFLKNGGGATGGNLTVAVVSSNIGWQNFSLVSTSPSDAVDVRYRVISDSISGGYVRADELAVTTGAPVTIYENDGTGADIEEDFDHITGGNLSEYSYTGGKIGCTGIWKRMELTAADAANWTDYCVHIDVENITNGPNKNTAAVLVRCAGGENYYGVLIDANDNLYVGKKTNNVWSWSSPVAAGTTCSAYSLCIDVSGSSTTNIDVYINGSATAAMNYSDSNNPHTTGGMGMETRGYHAAWDNIVVQ